jgi:translation initiation factor 1
MSKKKKHPEGVVYSTNPDFEYSFNNLSEATTLTPDAQKLTISLDKKMRAGKQVTLIAGFVGSMNDLESLTKILKTRCGVGGSAKEGKIILQGDFRDQVYKFLLAEGYKAKKI